MMLLLLMATAVGAYAQGNGMAGINEATKMVTSYFDPGTKLIYAIGAVVGLIGGIKVYNKSVRETPTQARPPLLVRCVYLLMWLPLPAFLLPVTMAEWEINKGIGRTVEFPGLEGAVPLPLCGGLLAVFISWSCYTSAASARLPVCHRRVGAPLVVVANVRHEPKVRAVRADEAGSGYVCTHAIL
jgi:hypothetical protein